MGKGVGRLGKYAVVHAEGKGTNDRRTVEERRTRIHRDGHKGTGMAAPHEPGHVMADVEGRSDLARRRERSLAPDEHDRVVFSRIFAGDIMESCRADGGGYLARLPGEDRLDHEPLVVTQQRRDVVEVPSGALSSITLSPSVCSTSIMTNLKPFDMPGARIRPELYMGSAKAR